jgi:hypothetical protein
MTRTTTEQQMNGIEQFRQAVETAVATAIADGMDRGRLRRVLLDLAGLGRAACR